MISKVSFCLLVASILTPRLFLGQNLVKNPSFECGIDPCELTYPHNIESFEQNVCEWSLPNNGTSDLWSTGIPVECRASMPVSTYVHDLGHPPIGSQLPRTGRRFAGIITYYGNAYIVEPPYREYIQIGLETPLEPGEHYCVEMFVSLAEAPMYAANNLGMLFHETKIERNSWRVPYSDRGFPLPYTPHIVEEAIITDSVNWVRVSDIFIADAPYQYLTIGNFSNDRETSSIQSRSSSVYKYAYYFIDDVSVEKIQDKTFTFSGETTICQYDTLQIKALGGFTDISWTNLSDTSLVISRGDVLNSQPVVSTEYRVRGRNCNLYVIDTISVTVKPVYTLNIGKDTAICVGSTLNLDAGPSFINYRWQDGSGARFYEVSSRGVYTVMAENNFGCYSNDEISVVLEYPPEQIDLGKDTLVCDSFFPIKAGISNGLFEWSDGSSDSVFIPNKSGSYWLTATNRCGVVSDTINVYSFQDMFVPNVVTLNHDGFNETFQITGLGESFYPLLNIFDRWGILVYEDTEYKGNWPRPNENHTSGVFYYLLHFPHCKSFKGCIQLIGD